MDGRNGETRAKLNGALRDALRKEKVAFIEVTTESVAENAIVATIVIAADGQEKATRIFGEVAKRFKGIELRHELKTPEDLAREKAETLRTILQALTGSEPYTVATIAAQAQEEPWVIVACLKALMIKGILQHVGEYDDNPVWTIEPKYATYAAAIAVAKEKGFDVG